MLPASNRNVGENFGFPDTCQTPTGTGADAPIPYPNNADNSQATNFANTVKIEGANAIHLGTTISQTSGDEAGTDNPTIKGKGAYTTGNPTIFIEQQMAISLASPTTGNASNNALGAVVVPSAATVFFSDRSLTELPPTLTARGLEALREAVAPSHDVAHAEWRGTTLVVRLTRFTEDVASRLHATLREAIAARGYPEAVVLDLRDNPGGDARAAEQVLDELLPCGAELFAIDLGDGDIDQRFSRGGVLANTPLTVLVNGGTASAAEAVAGTLSAHGRAHILGETTHGKTTVQHVETAPTGGQTYATVGRILVPSPSGLVPLAALDPEGAHASRTTS